MRLEDYGARRGTDHLKHSGSPPTVLVIDDEPQIRRVVRNALGATMRVLEASTARDGVDRAAAERPDIIVLDLGLPDADGLDTCREIRGWSAAPIVVLSARHADAEKVRLLDAGADDYVTKPFSSAELEARVRALLRRAAAAEGHGAGHIVVGDLDLDLPARQLTRRGARVHLTPIEWELLRVLMTNAGRTLTHQFLFRTVWTGRQFGDAQQYLRVHVANLRRKIEDDIIRPRYIQTEPGVGYRFTDPAALGRGEALDR